jgi:DMSO/TMAO reductase YedYZ molybdopterin-dependent catalytic subunit
MPASPELAQLCRRRFFTGGLSLGAPDSSDRLRSFQSFWRRRGAFDDAGVRRPGAGRAVNPNRLAETYPASAITKPFRFNAYYPEWPVRIVPVQWRLEVSGLVSDKTPWTLENLMALPQESQITRHICIEGWSQIGQWSGVPLHVFLRRIGADLRARYVAFKCFDGYSTSLDMASALHPQTILAIDFEDAPLTPEWGAPVRLRIPTKLGFKSAKNLQAIEVTNVYPGGFWEDQGYNWFSGS